jgi:glutamyl-tRNA synthetase
LYEDLRWAKLIYDEGPDIGGPYGPYRQSERLPIYDEHVNRLLKENKAYRCFCTPKQIDELNAAKTRALEAGQHHDELRSSNPCFHISAEESEERASKGEAYAVIYKPSLTPLQVDDIVYTNFRNARAESEFIIRKRDGFPTYHLANVVDDHLMKITHVIRGAEWLISTPRHVDLYRAFGWEPPQFAHVGLLVDKNRQKLSKRHDAVHLAWYKQMNIAPEALHNFAALLGWAPKNRMEKTDFMTLDDLVNNFHLKFTKGDVMVNLHKLEYLKEKHNVHLISQEPRDEAQVQDYIVKPLEKALSRFPRRPESDYKAAAISPIPKMALRAKAAYDQERGTITDLGYFLEATRFTTLHLWKPTQFAADYRWLLWRPPTPVLKESLHRLAETYSYQGLTISEVFYDRTEVMLLVRDILKSIPEEKWNVDFLSQAIKGLNSRVKRDKALPKENIYTPLQWALIAGENGPAVWEQMVFLGPEETLTRLHRSLKVARHFRPLKEAEEAGNTGAMGSVESEEGNATAAPQGKKLDLNAQDTVSTVVANREKLVTRRVQGNEGESSIPR